MMPPKLTNSGENFGIKRDGKLLAIESKGSALQIGHHLLFYEQLKPADLRITLCPGENEC